MAYQEVSVKAYRDTTPAATLMISTINNPNFVNYKDEIYYYATQRYIYMYL
jgi:hypothetical protein